MNIIDKVVGFVSPKHALQRAITRQAVNAVEQGGFGYGNHGASTRKSSMAGFQTQAGSAIEDIEYNVGTLRERSRDLFMGAPIATGALRGMVTNIVGAGLKLNTQIDYEYLGLTPEEGDAWETKVEREFAFWAESKNCDTTRMSNFYELQQLVFLSYLMSGDVFTTLPMIQRVGTPYELTVQVIEADRVCNPTVNTFLDEKLINGVEIDSKGEIVAYHVAKYHPSSVFSIQNKWTRIEKYGSKSGRPNILHLMDVERPEQRRGVPILAPVVELLKQLSRYSDAELMSAVISSMFTAFVTTEAPPNPELGGVSDGDQIDPDNDDTVELGNGVVNFLREGETVSFANPNRTNTAFDSFVTSICRQIGVALEIPYEVLMKHFTSSYSASRGALLEAWKMYKKRREWMANGFCQPIYELFLVEAVAKGRIYAPGFFTDPLVKHAYCKAEWNGPTQGQLDPEKEVRAAELRVKGGYSTRTRETTELTGGDFFKNHDLRVMEEKVRKEAGLVEEALATVPIDEQREEVEKNED
ncbi:phage portal protein [Psychrobacillus sp.]|uniref:phage portal protein n=1 Tax=Psychrobacillus sp. TaxID=1871623 RepID=UPI0028BF36D9|nr:phage portal protein [Psychrobacillus sp.]